jgi:hypothetical protein
MWCAAQNRDRAICDAEVADRLLHPVGDVDELVMAVVCTSKFFITHPFLEEKPGGKTPPANHVWILDRHRDARKPKDVWVAHTHIPASPQAPPPHPPARDAAQPARSRKLPQPLARLRGRERRESLGDLLRAAGGTRRGLVRERARQMLEGVAAGGCRRIRR